MDAKVKTPLVAALLIAATVIAYIPAISAGFIWDDPDYILNNPTLRTFDGLVQMWTDRHSLPQWYPLVHTTFWVEYQLWGTNPLGYHVVNILLHAASAIVLWRLLTMLRVPGALLAAAIFALHPVHVESVAWVTERKNVLSLLFYLLAVSAYLRALPFPNDHAPAKRSAAAAHRFDWKWYVASLALFLAALFSKTVTASLPAAILLVIWWKTGRIRMRDVLPTIPFFILGLVLALNTAHLEQARVGAMGHEWQYADTPLGEVLARSIIAGRALWFYAWKLVWPMNLAFIYERWTIDWRDPLQHVWPIAFLTVVGTLFALRNRIGRGPLVAVLFFAGTLFPALGFFNVFPHRYAFVADHFQYHASIGLIVLFAATLTLTAMRLRLAPALRVALACALLLPLGILTFRQTFIYENAETLWRDTVEKSPGNWMPWTNLGNALVAQKRYDEAMPYYQIALELAPHIDDVQYNAGHLAARQARYEDAAAHFRRAVEIKPTYLPAWESLGDLYANELDRPDEAFVAYLRAWQLSPGRAPLRRKLLETLPRVDSNNEQVKDLLRQMEAN